LNFKEGYSAVIIPLGNKNTLCLSTQIGCAMKCGFCMSGKREFVRNLSVDELKEQLEAARKHLGANKDEGFLSDYINSIVFMGMGEPLLNLDNVLKFCDWVNSHYGFSYAKIVISTSGIVPKMYEVIENKNKIQLAVSLHSPDQEIRDKIMPGLKGYSLCDLIEACHKYNETYRQKIMIEYIMIKGLTDRDCDLDALIDIKFSRRTNFNLIPLNSTFELEGKTYGVSSDERMAHFRDKLMGAGYKCFTRTSMGTDIEAACGMLR